MESMPATAWLILAIGATLAVAITIIWVCRQKTSRDIKMLKSSTKRLSQHQQAQARLSHALGVDEECLLTCRSHPKPEARSPPVIHPSDFSPVVEQLGKGAFSLVFKGVLRGEDVAFKCPKKGNCDNGLSCDC